MHMFILDKLLSHGCECVSRRYLFAILMRIFLIKSIYLYHEDTNYIQHLQQRIVLIEFTDAPN
jgi:hypothetical protein